MGMEIEIMDMGVAVLLLRVGAGFNAGGCGRAWFGYCGSTF